MPCKIKLKFLDRVKKDIYIVSFLTTLEGIALKALVLMNVKETILV